MAVHTITARNINALAGSDYPEAWRVTERLRRLITRLEARALRWHRYRKTVVELGNLSDAGLADIGMMRSDIPAVARAAATASSA